MSVLDLRSDPAAVDGPWLTAGLESAGVARGATVIDVDLQGFIGTGQMGRNARYALTWDDPAGRPTSVVGKFPTTDPTARATGFANGSYLKEYVFYSQLRPTVGVRTPEAFIALFDEAAPDFVLVMEDMAGSQQGDQMRGLTPDEGALAVQQAVALHAPHWGNDALLTLLGATLDDTAMMLQGLYHMTLEASLARLAPRAGDDAVALARELAPFVGRWVHGTDSPRTLVHMDFRPDNFMFAATDDAPPLAVVDWQTISYGLGATDVAYAIGGGFEPEVRADIERALVRDYAAGLRAAGVDYDDAVCWDDYRMGSIWGVVMSIIATMLAEQTERGDEMLSTMLRRHARQAADLDALSLVRG